MVPSGVSLVGVALAAFILTTVIVALIDPDLVLYWVLGVFVGVAVGVMVPL